MSAAALLRIDDRPTAIVTDSDQLAFGVFQAAAAAGLRVPVDLSVIGMDDTPTAALVTPHLTTIRQPLLEKGRTVGEIVLGRRSPKRRIVLPVELVVRGSAAPPAPSRRLATTTSNGAVRTEDR